MTDVAPISAAKVPSTSAILRYDLGCFVVKVFQELSPGRQYLHNWHIDAIAHQLVEVRAGRVSRLIISQPPRSLKSICTSVAFVAWCLGHDPSLRFTCVSYSADLAASFARLFRQAVMSDWYRHAFPNVHLTKETEFECETDAGGGRIAVAVGGSLTGRGADFIIIDDPLKAEQAQSDAERTRVNDWFRNTLLSRLNDKRRDAIVLVMQRLHEDDLVGSVLESSDEWRQLKLPAIAEDDEEIPVGPHAVYRRRRGEPLHEAREPFDVLQRIKSEMGSATFAAQYQQDPVPPGGNLIKADWIRRYERVPSAGHVEIVQSWDVATTTAANSDYSVCTTIAVVGRNYYIIDVWRDRVEFPQLKRQVATLAAIHRPNCVLIEKAGPGLQLLQELIANPVPHLPMPIGIVPLGDKNERMAVQAIRFEAGEVFVPHDAPWLDVCLKELLKFPHGRHDDQVDSICQALAWADQRRRFRRAMPLCGPRIIYG
jgi:predicted phage terminase large subunit-like protein